jgi:hypothetical protein
MSQGAEFGFGSRSRRGFLKKKRSERMFVTFPPAEAWEIVVLELG